MQAQTLDRNSLQNFSPLSLRRKAGPTQGRADLASLEAALESYNSDHGSYPRNEATDSLRADKSFDPKEYIAASKHLCASLQPKGGKVYFEFTKANTKIDADGQPYAVDPFGNSFGYSASQFTPSGPNFYDLWFTGGGTREKDVKHWVKNW